MSLLLAVRDAALARPRLLAPLLAGVAARRLLSSLLSSRPGPPFLVFAGALGGALATAAVAAVFAELWLGDGRRFDASRAARACLLFLLPYPLLLALGTASTPVLYALLRSNMEPGLVMLIIFSQVSVGKLAAFAAAALSALAVARRGERAGTLSAMGLAWDALRANAGFFALALAATLLVQEAAVYLVRASASSAGPGALFAASVFDELLAAGIALAGCVALPIEAWRSGRLKAA